MAYSKFFGNQILHTCTSTPAFELNVISIGQPSLMHPREGIQTCPSEISKKIEEFAEKIGVQFVRLFRNIQTRQRLSQLSGNNYKLAISTRPNFWGSRGLSRYTANLLCTIFRALCMHLEIIYAASRVDDVGTVFTGRNKRGTFVSERF